MSRMHVIMVAAHQCSATINHNISMDMAVDAPAAQAAPSIISVCRLSKTFASGFQALKGVDLDIRRGEIFALLGPNGAGKTTLISVICGLVNPTAGRVTVDGHDILVDY